MDRVNSRVFLKTADCGSFAEAAKALGYTQAGVSYIIGAMEKELGFLLFIREYGGVRLSPEGEALLPYIRALDNDNRLLDERIGDLRGLRCGSLRVLVFDSISVHWIPGILKAYKEDFPGINVEFITVENSREAEEMVIRQDVDCGFFLHTPRKKNMDVIPLMEEKLMAIVANDHPLAALDRFPLAKLGDYPYINMAFGNETGIAQIFRSRHIEPQTAYHMDNDYAAMAMVSAGHGFCIFPELLLRDVPYALRIMEFDEPVSRTVSIAVKSLDTCSAAAKKFIEYTRRWVEGFRKQ